MVHLYGTLKWEVTFHPDLAEFITKDDSGTDAVDMNVAISMAGIAYSTSRGMVLERTTGTVVAP